MTEIIQGAHEPYALQETAGTIRDFLTLLAVCHTVVPETDEEDLENGIIYQASSPGKF